MQRATHIGLAAAVLLWTLPAAGAQTVGAPAEPAGDPLAPVGGTDGAASGSPRCDTAHDCTEPVDRTYALAMGSAKEPGTAPARSQAYGDYMLGFACENAVDPVYENATGAPAHCR